MKRRNFLALAGAAAAFPRVAFAQQAAKLPRVALASSGVPTAAMAIGGDTNWSAILEQLASHGFVEGRTVVFERYLVPVDNSQQGAETIVESAPDAIFWGGVTVAARAARALTKTIPMVVFSADPVGDGLVDNAAHPGGNITGVSVAASADYEGKLLELLAEADPSASRFGYVVSGSNGTLTDFNQRHFDLAVAAAAKLSVSTELITLESGVSTEANYSSAFAVVASNHLDAVQFANDITAQVGAPIEGRLALAAKLPAIAPWVEFAQAGGLFSYGPDFVTLSRQAADYIALVLTGTKPGDLPILQPTVYDLVINQKTANAIGLTISQSLLAQASQVIE